MTPSGSKLDRARLQSYWTQVSERNLGRLDDGLSLICYAGMPSWFNRFYDLYQRKAFARLLRDEDFRGERVLDMGTGVGRWARWYAGWAGSSVVGIDIDPLRLAAAREYDPAIDYLEMPINEMAFPDASFDVVNCVTVLQHVDDETKRDALAEVTRVLKPGGRAVIFELTDLGDDAPHVFAWCDADWRYEFKKNGLSVTRVTGDQYTPVLRAMKAAYGLLRGGQSRRDIDALKGGKTNLALLVPLRLAVLASYPIEEVARFLPIRMARITGYLLRKG